MKIFYPDQEVGLVCGAAAPVQAPDCPEVSMGAARIDWGGAHGSVVAKFE